MRVLHILPGLGRGGAETQITRLLSERPEGAAVFCIRSPGPQAEAIRSLGVTVYSGDATGIASPGWVWRLRRATRLHQPDVACGWLYHGNLAASLAGLQVPRMPVIWNVLHSLHALQLEKLTIRLSIRAGAILSARPDRIVYNSTTAAKQHEACGYRPTRRVIIPNGFDVQVFRPDPAMREAVRQELAVGNQDLLVGVVGRAHPLKNHAGFVRAIAMLVPGIPGLKAVIVGREVDSAGSGLPALVDGLGVNDVVRLLPETGQPERFYPAFDLFVLPSWSEAFPNVVGEAMACGVPCVVTNVGDAAEIVGDTGRAVDAGDEAALAGAIAEMLELPADARRGLGARARARVITRYSLSAAGKAYGALCRELVHARPGDGKNGQKMPRWRALLRRSRDTGGGGQKS